MGEDRFARVDTVVQSALMRPPEAREAFVRDACADDVDLRDEVMSLLAHAVSADGFLEASSALIARPLHPASSSAHTRSAT